jgi:predicted ATPase
MVYGPTDFSDGTIRFIALATLFLQPTPPKVIIIDEPELGLHPVAIQKLAGMMHVAASKGTQIIVATQSTDLLCHFEPEEVITVNQVEGATQMVRLNSEDLNHWLEDYTLGDLWKQNIVKGGQPE